ncbi:MAG: hypothetical protein HY747_07605 [Elusimicrobia bacterium]|nr:hypothetical protein [Elusimicrobiota bacterium]
MSQAIRRMGGKRDRMEQKTSFLRKVRRAYLRLAKGRKDIIVVRADKPIEQLHVEIVKIVWDFLKSSAKIGP